MFVIVEGFGGIDATPVDVVRLVASAVGIEDVDIEPGIGERVTISSTLGPVPGKNMTDACVKFLRRVFDK